MAIETLAFNAASAANYSAIQHTDGGVEVVRLTDAAHKTEVSIIPSLGNIAWDMKVNGKRVLWSPYDTVAEFRAKPVHLGTPFLAPWANRLESDVFWVNGKSYRLNPELKNFQYDGNRCPIHGLVQFAPEWKITELRAGADAATVTSRLEFWRQPGWMAQFPFAHNIDMTYRLTDGVVQVETRIENLSSEPMPVAIGFHPYFTVSDAPRDEWTVHLPVTQHIETTSHLIPTGELKPVHPEETQSLKNVRFDDGFTGLARGVDQRAEFWIKGKSQKISVFYGPKYPVAVVYAPPGRDFICFEPMAAPTDAFNLAHAGKWKQLESIPAGGTWIESYWIATSGF